MKCGASGVKLCCILTWMLVMSLIPYVKIKAQLDDDMHVPDDSDLTFNPFLNDLPPEVCRYPTAKALTTECCLVPPLFPREDFKKCFRFADLKPDGGVSNCSKLNCVFQLYNMVDEDGFLIYKEFVKYMDYWVTLHSDYARIAAVIETECFFIFANVLNEPCLMLIFYECYLDLIKKICPVYHTDGYCQYMPEYKRLCKDLYDTATVTE